MQSIKKTVHFKDGAHFQVWEPHGTVAHVYAMDHPKLGMGPVRTSLVQKVNDDGSFETLNTIYIPIKEGVDET